jgi:hypothetical protein
MSVVFRAKNLLQPKYRTYYRLPRARANPGYDPGDPDSPPPLYPTDRVKAERETPLRVALGVKFSW